MASDGEGPVTIAFVGYAGEALAGRASRYEDEVLPLLADHGATVLFRGRRRPDQDASLPHEVHVLRFPSRAALDGYLADERRARLLERHGEVFDAKHAVEVAVVTERLA